MDQQEFNTRDAAEYLDLSQGHLLRLIRQDKISARLVETPGGFYYLVEKATLDDWLSHPHKPGKQRRKKDFSRQAKGREDGGHSSPV